MSEKPKKQTATERRRAAAEALHLTIIKCYHNACSKQGCDACRYRGLNGNVHFMHNYTTKCDDLYLEEYLSGKYSNEADRDNFRLPT